MTYFHLNILKENIKSVAKVCFAMLYELYCIILKMNQGYASISIDVTPPKPKQKTRYVDETSRVDSLLNHHCTEIIMIYIYT